MLNDSLSAEQAKELARSGWWKDIPLEQAAMFQLFTVRLCMSFGDFHEGIEKLLGRPVWTHEFAFCDRPGGLRDEALGKSDAPTFEQIMDLILEEKRIVLVLK